MPLVGGQQADPAVVAGKADMPSGWLAVELEALDLYTGHELRSQDDEGVSGALESGGESGGDRIERARRERPCRPVARSARRRRRSGARASRLEYRSRAGARESVAAAESR